VIDHIEDQDTVEGDPGQDRGPLESITLATAISAMKLRGSQADSLTRLIATLGTPIGQTYQLGLTEIRAWLLPLHLYLPALSELLARTIDVRHQQLLLLQDSRMEIH